MRTLLALACLLLPFASSAQIAAPLDDLSAPPFVTAKSWAIADGKTGTLLWGYHAAEPQKSASTTKVMCAYVILQLAAKDPSILEQTVTFSALADKTGGTTAGVAAGESLSVRECLYGLLLPSGNDAGNALAEHFNARFAPPGKELKALHLEGNLLRTRANFIAEMNRTARRLGLKDTTYRMPYGDGGTTEDRTIPAAELTKLAWHALKEPLLRTIVSTQEYDGTIQQLDGTPRTAHWTNTNKLLATGWCDGVKTGSSKTAGTCLVASVHRQGDHLLVAILGSDSDASRYVDIQNLIRWGWQQRAKKPAAP